MITKERGIANNYSSIGIRYKTCPMTEILIDNEVKARNVLL